MSTQVKLTVLIKLTDSISGLGQVVKTVEVEDGHLIHVETREPRPDSASAAVTMELLLTLEVRDGIRRKLQKYYQFHKNSANLEHHLFS